MIAAHQQSVRVLQGVLVAAIALPALLFGYVSWQGYRNAQDVADRQIAISRDVLTEHALKVFEGVDRSIAEVDEIIRGMTDTQIIESGARLHERLKQIAAASSQTKSLWVFDRNGEALVNSLEYPAPRQSFADRDYFRVHIDRDIGTFVGEVLQPRPPYGGAPFFGVSRRRSTSDGRFDGVIQASVLPEYFEGFYGRIGRSPGSYYSLIRADGVLLARYPKLDRDVRLAPNGDLWKAIQTKPIEGTLSLVSKIDGLARTVSYLRLPSVPVYVVAGRDAWAVRQEWLAQMRDNLAFGLPPVVCLLIALGLALRRTKRLYEEASGRQLAEAALKQSQRLEAVGQLTGGVAHDFNNLLMVIGGAAGKLARTGHLDPRSLEMIQLAVQRGESLTRKLLSLSRRRTLTPQVIDLTAALNALRGVLAQAVTGDIALHFELPANPIVVELDPNELEIALVNLIVNARDAMPEGGEIAVRLTRASIGEVPDNLRGPHAAISVSDTGSGIPEAIRERIFEPFFTTKPAAKGTGLGLSQVLGFVTQAGGTVTVASEKEGGTRFTLFLPVSAQHLQVSPASIPDTTRFDGLRVLLVEDNPDVVAIAADYLAQCGCNVLRANSAESAVAALNDGADVDLVFSDIAMPGMNGLELARLVRDHHPEIPVILATGYHEKAARAGQEGFPLLEKPYDLAALRQALRAAFPGSPPGH